MDPKCLSKHINWILATIFLRLKKITFLLCPYLRCILRYFYFLFVLTLTLIVCVAHTNNIIFAKSF